MLSGKIKHIHNAEIVSGIVIYTRSSSRGPGGEGFGKATNEYTSTVNESVSDAFGIPDRAGFLV
jgi:hypothetical protein